MAKVIWTRKAFNQLERNIRFIREERGVTYASIVLDKIISVASRLENFPESGVVEELLKLRKGNYRYVIAFSYKSSTGLKMILL